MLKNLQKYLLLFICSIIIVLSLIFLMAFGTKLFVIIMLSVGILLCLIDAIFLLIGKKDLLFALIEKMSSKKEK